MSYKKNSDFFNLYKTDFSKSSIVNLSTKNVLIVMDFSKYLKYL